MIINRRSWQSYIMSQLMTLICSLVPAALTLTELTAGFIIGFLPLALSLLLFTGTLIIGERPAWLELSRRFHI